jgi:DNA-binding NarL/FixJ family response regulator
MSKLNFRTFFQQKKILVIDDCQMILNATRLMLIKNGCSQENIVIVKEARSAIVACKTHKFDFILCDYNLGQGTDGLQLIEQLTTEKLIPKKTVIFVVTGEMSKSVFYGFAEFEPDGYLIKPLNINAISERLVNSYRQKQTINSIHNSYKTEGMVSALALCDKYKNATSVTFARALLYINEQKIEKAQQIYVELINNNSQIARIHLANLLMTQKKYDLALKLITPLINNNQYRFKALQVQAKCYLLLNNIVKSLEAFQQLNTMSANNVERLLTYYNLAIENAEFDLMLSLSQKTSSRLSNSIWHTVDQALNHARSYLIRAENETNISARASFMTDFTKRIKSIEKQFKLADYQWHRNLLKARFMLLDGDLQGALNIWNDYQQEEQLTDFYAHLDELYLMNAIGEPAVIKSPELGESNLHLTQKSLLNYVHNKHRRTLLLVKSIKVKAHDFQKNKDFSGSVTQWLQAWQLKPFDSDVALSLIKGFSLSIPMNIPVDQLKLAYQQAEKTIALKVSKGDLPNWFSSTNNEVKLALLALENA